MCALLRPGNTNCRHMTAAFVAWVVPLLRVLMADGFKQGVASGILMHRLRTWRRSLSTGKCLREGDVRQDKVRALRFQQWCCRRLNLLGCDTVFLGWVFSPPFGFRLGVVEVQKEWFLMLLDVENKGSTILRKVANHSPNDSVVSQNMWIFKVKVF